MTQSEKSIFILIPRKNGSKSEASIILIQTDYKKIPFVVLKRHSSLLLRDCEQGVQAKSLGVMLKDFEDDEDLSVRDYLLSDNGLESLQNEDLSVRDYLLSDNGLESLQNSQP
ncbi:hypothetical protein QE152_g19166 [Popillia japonica]|uniref:Uncharacterized protein n=1 Tax=Popillia japonica TaxID=7064 RepID=A0AAW1L2D0_POPJA